MNEVMQMASIRKKPNDKYEAQVRIKDLRPNLSHLHH